MSTSSAAAGYLQPTQSPIYGDALDSLFQGAIASLSNLPGDLVRPRWQHYAPKTPPIDTDWCAVGIHNIARDWGATVHIDEMIRHEEIELLCSFYGPGAMDNATLTQDNLTIEQNFTELEQAGLFYRRFDDVIPAPELINDQWLKRYDLTVYFGRAVHRTYNIESIESAEIDLYNDVGIPYTKIEVVK